MKKLFRIIQHHQNSGTRHRSRSSIPPELSFLANVSLHEEARIYEELHLWRWPIDKFNAIAIASGQVRSV